MTECTRCHQDRGYSRICVHCITEILADHDDHLFRLQAKLAAAEARAERLAKATKGLLHFIETFNIGGDWCQDNYLAIKQARAALADNEGE